MSDQADRLRCLVRERASAASAVLEPRPAAPVSAKARSLVLASGKGGVGTSNLALNLAIALGELGQRVVLVDADLGLANLDLLCGLTPSRDLGDVLAGEVSLEEILVEGPAGVTIVPGAHGIRALPEALDDAPARLANELSTLEHAADRVIVDAGSGLGAGLSTLGHAADEVAIVTTPEPTSLADAHAAIAGFRRAPEVRLRAVATQTRSASEGRDVLDHLCLSSRQFLGAVVTPLGHVRFDPRIRQAVRARSPLILAAPRSPAARDVANLARSWLAERPDRGRARRPGFFQSLAARWALGRVAR